MSASLYVSTGYDCGRSFRDLVCSKLYRWFYSFAKSPWPKVFRTAFSKLLHTILLQSGFVQCFTDTCLYYKDAGKVQTVVVVYVDDLLVTVAKSIRNALVAIEVKVKVKYI